MSAEVTETLQPGPGRVLVDGTLGDGGHAAAWLEAGGMVVGIDQDPVALVRAARRCEPWHDRLHIVHGAFAALDVLGPRDLAPDAVLLDLGTSRAQIEDPARGFSYLSDGPLDMRMDTTSGHSVADLLRFTPVEELASWLRELGDVPHARRVARAIVKAGPPVTTGALAAAVERQFPPRLAMKSLSCVFQALRMVANDECRALEGGLDASLRALRPGGRMAVLTYHSGEERMVRGFLRRQSGQCTCPQGLPVCSCGSIRRVVVVERGRRPRQGELDANPRARSARLWAAERVDVQ
ncbi:MAG: 16S rRNA (cytosine(1402)-N(4))-methyltransferase RsmH [Candidatus Eisenbacteria bacterium]|nr:16S rRNA (cytosine(1402)-N(4))-methyltransferase RsmH [Candidatus Eisenbacteria bacterium]